jgi:hypothetical protein
MPPRLELPAVPSPPTAPSTPDEDLLPALVVTIAEPVAVGASALAELDGLVDAARLAVEEAVDVGATVADLDGPGIGDGVGTISRHAIRETVLVTQPLEMSRVRPLLSYAKPAPQGGGADQRGIAQRTSAVVSAESATATRKWRGPGPAADSRITSESVS